MTKTMPEYIPIEDMKKIVFAASGNDYYELLFYFALRTGRRLGEIYNLQVKNINIANRTAVLGVLKTRRKNNKKEVVFNEKMAFMFDNYIRKYKLKLNDYIFQKVTRTQIQRAVKKYAKAAGIIENCTFHNFRHALITHLLKKGWTYDIVSKITGHIDIRSLSAYDHTTSEDFRTRFEDDISGI